ncbi:zinc-dependent alcohol dehydrogenase family protein [Roseateles cellulosilyticus]|uniref:NAD(P)-dependent alcohol dehydrogenase n=1 Tax=Pelomonas cellulosilytica TaxID=2906762 RepID=A0ABS8XUD0_9BURK|nr:NAD(P)-dependent alcohol dehydrogenase [Pelomonas sp. P8]MCE4552855.1 NAD(P)-dependent alcohol dehydrogenase [Pelomonas sp. P8]
MDVYEIGPQQGLDGLRRTQRPFPKPGHGQALLRLRAACLNHRDLLVLQGRYGALRPESRVPLSDGIGEVIAVGPGCGELRVGHRAIAPHFVSWLDGDFHMSAFAADLGTSLDGWLAETVLVPAAALVAVPDALGDEQAAPLCAAGVTAWHALVEWARVKAGDLVLALGTGGVSIFALQLAKLHGARVAITSSSDEKLAVARALGADLTINYRTHPDWAAELLRVSGGQGADIVLETGGMATLPASIDAAATNGRIALIGALGGYATNAVPNVTTLVMKNLTIKGITSGSRAMLARLVQAAAANGLSPLIDREFGFEEAAAAYAHLQAAGHVGKVLIRGR